MASLGNFITVCVRECVIRRFHHVSILSQAKAAMTLQHNLMGPLPGMWPVIDLNIIRWPMTTLKY